MPSLYDNHQFFSLCVGVWGEYHGIKRHGILLYIIVYYAIVLSAASLQKGKTPSPNKSPGYDIIQSDCEASVMLEL